MSPAFEASCIATLTQRGLPRHDRGTFTLAVFAVFSVTYLGERLTLNHAVGFGFIAVGAWFVFKGPL